MLERKDRFFGLGTNDAYGEESAQEAYENEINESRKRLLKDTGLFGGEKGQEIHIGRVADRFDSLIKAVEAADRQVHKDNAEFIKTHKIKTFEIKGATKEE